MDKNNNAIEIVKSLPDYAPIPKTALGPTQGEKFCIMYGDRFIPGQF